MMDAFIGMSSTEGFHDFLFEISNEIRYEILVSLREEAKRITDITKSMDLKTPETRRHVTRLSNVGLIQRDIDGFYHITPYGEGMLTLLKEFDFLTRHRVYFQSHTLTTIPTAYLKQIGELEGSRRIDDAMDFLRQTESLIREAKEHILLLVDQFPLNSLATIVEAIERGVQFRVIEPRERTLNPDIESMTSEETQALNRTRHTPLVNQRMVDNVNVYMLLSEKRGVIAFPTSDGRFDYMGFTFTDSSALNWSTDLFEHYWGEAETRITAPSVKIKRSLVAERGESNRQIVVDGQERPDIDAQAIQDAVDNYDEVILKGSFNLGTSTIYINRSVVLRGEGRENDIPSTKVYKKGWVYPIIDTRIGQNRVFLVDEEGIDVTIENIHFTDFEFNCIGGRNGNSLTIKNNRITLRSGFGRGRSSPVGNQVIGIFQTGGFPGGVRIEGNYLDFATSYGPVERSLRINARADDPNYRPDLKETYSYIAFGIDIFNASGEVIIENNIVRNMNARGIVIGDNTESAYFHVKNNTIISEIYGAHYGPKPFAGHGIIANSGWSVGSAPHIEILDNTIRCDKVNYCGIGLRGPELGPEGAIKFNEGKVNNNSIQLEDGSIGIYTESCDRFQIIGNTISGKALYGIGIFPGVDDNRTELGSYENVIEDNDMSNLSIKDPNEYSKILLDEKKYPGSKAGSATAHVWLNINTRSNRVIASSNETVIDEGVNNEIIHK